jgi:transposase InsO family protein
MTWQPRDLMNVKREFLELALKEGANRRELCRRFGISAKTGYALLARHAQHGMQCCTVRSSKPHHSPTQTPAAVEQAVVAMRQAHPCWGGRKIARRLADLHYPVVPPPSTITTILHRHGLITPAASQAATAWQRFEHAEPNALWQIDFKGHFETAQGRCNPLTLLDDHSRFNLALAACARPDAATVQQHLQAVFERYGLPQRINADNGPPWGSPSHAEHGLTALSVWLIRLGLQVSHSAPYHPQTNGKIERFHRSLKAELLQGRSFASLHSAQQAFTRWRDIYNHQRPHDALAMGTPIQRYSASQRRFSVRLAPIEYSPQDTVIEVGWNGWIKWQGRKIRISSALHRLPIALRADTEHDGRFDVFFCHQRFMRLDLNAVPTNP